MRRVYRVRVIVTMLVTLFLLAFPLSNLEVQPPKQSSSPTSSFSKLELLQVKGRAPKTGYERSQFGDGWQKLSGCSVREVILARDLINTSIDNKSCKVLSGMLHDPYTAKVISYTRGAVSSQAVQIDHVVALSNAWQTGAHQLDMAERVAFANDPENLLAVDGPANQQKSDGDAATWLPSNKSFRCQYVVRQIDVKSKYQLWVTSPEKAAMLTVLQSCN